MSDRDYKAHVAMVNRATDRQMQQALRQSTQEDSTSERSARQNGPRGAKTGLEPIMGIDLDIPTSTAERVRRENIRKLAREIADGSIIMDAIARFIDQVVHEVRNETLAQATRAEVSNASRMRDAIVEARRQLAKGRALWNGPCVQCDAVLEQALRADSDAEAMVLAAQEDSTSD